MEETVRNIGGLFSAFLVLQLFEFLGNTGQITNLNIHTI